ncbi:hypothetical protein N2152v2_009977 [Parachlorella kessleri]
MPLTSLTLPRHRPLSHHTWPTQRIGGAGACITLQLALFTCRRNRTCGSSGGGSRPVFHHRLGKASVIVAAAHPQPSSSSSSPAQPFPLHACLLRHGITDLAAFSGLKHLALGQEAVSSSVEPKLAALAAEGLSPKQVASILAARDSPLPCTYAETFQPNLQLLREIAAHIKYRPHPKAPQLTAVGKVLAGSPNYVAMYLSRDRSKVQQLLQCLDNDLGIGLKQLASCSALTSLVNISASSAQGAIALLLDEGVPVQQARLPPLLCFLDTYMGEEGAGRRLVRAQPVLGDVNAAAAKRSTDSLAARGYSQHQIQVMVGKEPKLLALNLDSPLQRQKLDWIERVSPWTLDDLLDTPRYFIGTKTRRLAARLALLREAGLQPPPSPGTLATYSDASFMATLRKQLARQGRDLPWASWAEWEGAWLGTEEGREWGFPPLKE